MAVDRDDNIPSDVQKFIAEYVKSVGHLETLLFLFNHRDSQYSAVEVSRELRTNEAYAEHQLKELSVVVNKTTVQGVGTFSYKGSEEIDAAVSKLVIISRERPHAVINFIYSTPLKKDSILDFADAFKLKKD